MDDEAWLLSRINPLPGQLYHFIESVGKRTDFLSLEESRIAALKDLLDDELC